MFGCQERKAGIFFNSQFQMFYFIGLMWLIFIIKIYDMVFLIAIKYYFISYVCANCAHHLPYRHFPLVVNCREQIDYKLKITMTELTIIKI